MSAPTPPSGGGIPGPGYYPDPSIPGYVRFWNGAAWVPGTSRPATEGEEEPAAPPPDAAEEPEGSAAPAAPYAQEAAGAPGASYAPAAAPLPAREETGPMFLDEEEPQDAVPARARGVVPEDEVGDAVETAAEDVEDAPSPWRAVDVSERSADRVSWGTGTRQDPPALAVPTELGGGRPEEPGRAEQPGAYGEGERERYGAGAYEGPGWTGEPAARSQSAAGGDASPAGGPPELPAGSRRYVPTQSVTPARREPGEPGELSEPSDPRAAGASPWGEQVQQLAGSAPARPVPAAPQQPAAQPERRPTVPTPPTPTPTTPDVPRLPAQSGPAAAPPRPTAPDLPQQPAQSGPVAGPAPGSTAAPRPIGTPVPPTGRPPSPGPTPQSAALPERARPELPRAGGAGGEGPVPPWRPPASDPFAAQATAPPAGLGRRLGARIVDGLLVGGVTAAVAVPLVNKSVKHIQDKIDAAERSGQTVTVWLVDGTTGPYLALVLGLFLLLGLLVEALPTGKWGRTPGKRLFGVRVLDIEAQDPPGTGRALRRWLTYAVLALLPLVGLLNVVWCAFDKPWRQCWHDKAGRTYVARG